MIEDIISRVSARIAELEELQRQLNVELKTAFMSGAKELLTEYPNITAIAWTQYTPYFNDGDTCDFWANIWNFQYLGTDNDEFNDEWEEYEPTVGEDKTAYKAWSTFLEAFNQDFYNWAFGDHVKVTITADGIEVEEYSYHD